MALSNNSFFLPHLAIALGMLAQYIGKKCQLFDKANQIRDLESDLECNVTEPTAKDLWKIWKVQAACFSRRNLMAEKKLRRKSETEAA